MSLNSTPLFYKRPTVYKVQSTPDIGTLALPLACPVLLLRGSSMRLIAMWCCYVDLPCGIPLCFPQRGFAMC